MESSRTPVDIYRETIEAMNEGNKERFRRALADDAVEYEKSGGEVYQGADLMTAAAWGFRAAFPDLHGEITNAFDSGDRGVMEVVWQGTHSGDFQLSPSQIIPATGKKIEWPICYVFRVRDGKTAEFSTYFDTLALYNQLGLSQDSDLFS